MHDDSKLATLLTTPAAGHGTVTPPIVQTSLFTFQDYDSFVARMAGQSDAPVYTRVQNPTVAEFERLMAQAEGAEAAVGFASGMGAIAAAIMAFIQPGQRIACVEHVYSDTYRLLERTIRPMGIEIDYHPINAFEEQPDLLKGYALAYLESPSSIVMQVMNLQQVAEHARRHGVVTMTDNSWATPVFQQPRRLGVDIVLHSASKYIGGHSDTVAGVAVGSAEHIGRIRDLTLPLLGAKLAPFEAFLLTRSLRTLHLRMERHQATANHFVDRLGQEPLVRQTHSPGANAVPGLTGRSGLLSLELDPDVDVARFCNALSIFRLGVSWGGFESLALPAQASLSQAGQFNSMQRFGVSPQLVRLSLGLEDPEDLWCDFHQALQMGTN